MEKIEKIAQKSTKIMLKLALFTAVLGTMVYLLQNRIVESIVSTLIIIVLYITSKHWD